MLSTCSDEELAEMSISELSKILQAHDVPLDGCLGKNDLVDRVKSQVLANIHTKWGKLFDLAGSFV